MNIKNSILDYIRCKQLNWYSYVPRMSEKRLPQKNLGTVSTWMEEEEEEEEE